MFNIVLFEPEIPPNTGNIIRLAANTGCQLHLIKPLGFDLNEKKLRRAGLDYHEFAKVNTYENYDDFIEKTQAKKIYALTTKGSRCYTKVEYQADDFLLFGPETRGLPAAVREGLGPEHCIRVPMLPDSRSLNLSNTVAVIVYHAWHQHNFGGRQ
jgi:tRNA (cytidine/uridine-2'-O-)-methyltransferase